MDATTYRYVIRAVDSGAGGAHVESVDSIESPATTADGISPSFVTLADPGSPLRGAVILSGTASDAGSGIVSLRFQHAAAGASDWSDGCTADAAPYSCSVATGSLTDGLYDLRILASDAAGNTTTSNVVLNRRVDNTSPSVTMSDPGAFLRATVTLTASADDAGSGITSVSIQRAPSGSSTWTTVCTTTASPFSCALNTTTLANGGYDLRAIATDAAANTTTSATASDRVVDNTAPTGVDVQAANGPGGRPNTPGPGDVVTFTFSEPMSPASILAGWAGLESDVTVRFTNGNTEDVLTVYDGANTPRSRSAASLRARGTSPPTPCSARRRWCSARTRSPSHSAPRADRPRRRAGTARWGGRPRPLQPTAPATPSRWPPSPSRVARASTSSLTRAAGRDLRRQTVEQPCRRCYGRAQGGARQALARAVVQTPDSREPR